MSSKPPIQAAKPRILSRITKYIVYSLVLGTLNQDGEVNGDPLLKSSSDMGIVVVHMKLKLLT